MGNRVSVQVTPEGLHGIEPDRNIIFQSKSTGDEADDDEEESDEGNKCGCCKCCIKIFACLTMF
tara:strand:- start:2066 stop:2257 length:192 start_codon:yes stop_codon:yes gene_type:complete